MSRSGRNTRASSSMPWSCNSMKKWSRPKMSWKRAGRFERGLLVAGEDQLRDEPAEAPARGRDAGVVALEQLPVAARLVVVAVEVRAARDLDEVAVALVGLGEHREVEDLVLGPLRAIEARRVGEVALHAEHGLHVGLARRGVHRQRAVHVAVVGDADRGLAVGGDRGHDVADPRCTVEHRVLGVQVQMDERIVALAQDGLRFPLSTAPVHQAVDNYTRCHSSNLRREPGRCRPVTRMPVMESCRPARHSASAGRLPGLRRSRPLRESRSSSTRSSPTPSPPRRALGPT